MSAIPPSPPALTGERTVPGVWHETYWHARHVAAYRWAYGAIAAHTGRGRVVLEAGCGEGYGTAFAPSATRVLGVDYDDATTTHAARRYGGRASFARANLVALPLADDAIDAALCLQVIEHIWSPGVLVSELARTLRPGGVLTLSTPNRPVFSPGLGRGERPPNPFHVQEFDADELTTLIGGRFRVSAVRGVRPGPRLRRLDSQFGSFTAAQLADRPQDWPAELARAVRSVTADDFLVTPLTATAQRGPDDVLDLLLLAHVPDDGAG